VDVLVFDNSNSKFLCHAPGEDIADASGGGNAKTFIVDLSEAGDVTSVQVMVIANAHTIVTAAVGNTIISGTTTATEAMTKLEFTCPGKWNVTKATATDFTPFPMWGMETVDLSDIESIQAISLMRAVAKIDVGLNFNGETAQGLSTFKLESVYLYNSHGKGSVSPYSGNYSGATATAVSIPSAAAVNTTNPVPYDKATTTDGFSGDVSCMNAIYMAEHAAGTAGNANNACLVVGGKYNGEATTTWYRIDFVNTSGTYLPVLRNHRYKVNIKSVVHRGYATAAEALVGDALAAVQISVTNESLTSHAYNKDYSLSVSTDAFTLANNAVNTTGAISLSTSYPGGYTTAVTSTGSWLAISAGGSSTAPTATGSLNTITVRASSANTTGSPRSGTVTVTSGLLTRAVTVTQPAAKTFTVANALAEYPANGGLQTLAVTSNCEWCVKLDYLGNIVVSFDTGVFTGNKNFAFTLIDNDPVIVYGDDLSATFTFYSPAGEFEPVSRTVKLPELATTYIPTPVTSGGWAGSNIYWDGSKLTFADADTTDKGYYQGVYFRWGSLWGLDASGGYWSTSKIVYKPNAATNGWTSATGYAGNNIPYAASSDVNDKTRAFLYEIHNPSIGKGDICRYITDVAGGSLYGKRWRMPTYSEYENADWGGKTGTFSDVSSSANRPDGTWQNPNKPAWKMTSGVVFPASGCLSYTSLELFSVGTDNSGYRTSSATGPTTYGVIDPDPGDLESLVPATTRSQGSPVRCVSY
ncbi:MAG: BACON domain-containing protein, partial [Prevotella sp.]|nr:BACON domain-containing protein [Prevotella sp.]